MTTTLLLIDAWHVLGLHILGIKMVQSLSLIDYVIRWCNQGHLDKAINQVFSNYLDFSMKE